MGFCVGLPSPVNWNYRICYRPSSGVPSMQLHEVYYDEDGEVKFYSERPMSPFGDDEVELHRDLIHMMNAFDHEPINLDEMDILLQNRDKK